jgi:hypothetical protein
MFAQRALNPVLSDISLIIQIINHQRIKDHIIIIIIMLIAQ